MTGKSKANAFVKKFKSSALGQMNIIEKNTTAKAQPGKSYAVLFTLPPRSNSTLKAMRAMIKSQGGSSLDLSKGDTLRGIGTMYAAFFRN